MMIIGCDFHTRYQQIAMMDEGGWPGLSHPHLPQLTSPRP